MTRYQAMQELISCARSRLDEIELQGRISSDPDTLSCLSEDRDKLSSALDKVTYDQSYDVVGHITVLGEFARAVAVIRNRLIAMFAHELPDCTHDAHSCLSFLETIIEDDAKFIEFTRSLADKGRTV